jgi:small subunit ribosomal protein S1
MVSKQPYKLYGNPEGGPPPLDESWWDAIMAEDDVHRPTPARQGTYKARSNGVDAALRTPNEPPTMMDWDLAVELYELDRIITLQVCGYNRGGLLVSGEGLQGFVPISHLVELTAEKSVTEQEQCLKAYTGRQLQLKIIECDPERGRVVFSERAALAKPGSRNLLLHQLQPGQCIQGTVTNITDFGVFVDLGGVEGLIHVSEISWGRVRHPSDVVQYGEQITVHVLNVDPERSRVALSMKRLFPNPWETAEERYFPGQVTEAVITSLVPFGAFARLEEGLDGLIHISEIGPGEPPASLSELLHEGQLVKVRVLHVDAFKQRLGLSMIMEE